MSQYTEKFNIIVHNYILHIILIMHCDLYSPKPYERQSLLMMWIASVVLILTSQNKIVPEFESMHFQLGQVTIINVVRTISDVNRIP